MPREAGSVAASLPKGEGPEAFAASRAVSPAVLERLAKYVALLRTWQKAKNLVGPSTLDHVWTRHIADSAGVLDAAPWAKRWADLGSGAGFPGIVVAILLSETPGAHVHLVESNGRKAAFLKAAIRETGAPASVSADRIEAVLADPARVAPAGPVEAVSARALAPLDKLLGLAEPLLAAGAVGVFHKGRDLDREVCEARALWSFDLVEHRSISGSDSRIALVRSLAPRRPGVPEP